MQFPPGVTVYCNKAKSEWREFAFAFHQIQQAIDPVISLKKVLAGWAEITGALAENPRKRKPQVANFNFS